jgi:tRNA (guanine-N7-)-methyltransferase
VLQRPSAGQINVNGWFTDPSRPLEVEIGSGKGTFLVQQAPTQPGTNFLGIEYAHDFYLYAADRVRRLSIPNVKMLCTDAAEFVHWRIPDRSVSVLHLYFADPWPKARHHRRRMVSDRFLTDCLRIIVPGGELRIVTDHPDYWTWMEEHFARWCAPVGPYTRTEFLSPPTAREGEVVGTNFERKYREEGRDFHAATLVTPR